MVAILSQPQCINLFSCDGAFSHEKPWSSINLVLACSLKVNIYMVYTLLCFVFSPTYILHGYFAGTGAMIWVPHCQQTMQNSMAHIHLHVNTPWTDIIIKTKQITLKPWAYFMWNTIQLYWLQSCVSLKLKLLTYDIGFWQPCTWYKYGKYCSLDCFQVVLYNKALKSP